MSNQIRQDGDVLSPLVDDRRRIVTELHERASGPLASLQFELARLGRTQETGAQIRQALIECQQAVDEVERQIERLSAPK